MFTDDHWITSLVSDARKAHPLVTEAVSARMVELLKGKLGEHQLTSLELANAAKKLIGDLDSVPCDEEPTQ